MEKLKFMKEHMNFEIINWDSPIPVIQYQSLMNTGCVEHGF